MSLPPSDPGRERAQRRAWRILVGLQLAAVALVAAAVLAVWLIGLSGDLYGHR